jgi:hypothetical protein
MPAALAAQRAEGERQDLLAARAVHYGEAADREQRPALGVAVDPHRGGRAVLGVPRRRGRFLRRRQLRLPVRLRRHRLVGGGGGERGLGRAVAERRERVEVHAVSH